MSHITDSAMKVELYKEKLLPSYVGGQIPLVNVFGG